MKLKIITSIVCLSLISPTVFAGKILCGYSSRGIGPALDELNAQIGNRQVTSPAVTVNGSNVIVCSGVN